MRETNRTRAMTLLAGLGAALVLLTATACGPAPLPEPGEPIIPPVGATAALPTTGTGPATPSPIPDPTAPDDGGAADGPADGQEPAPDPGGERPGPAPGPGGDLGDEDGHGGGEDGGGEAGIPRCDSSLTVTAGTAEGAAGSVYRRLVFANGTGNACDLVGIPGVSYVTGEGGAQVGAPAERSGAEGGPPLRLPSGGSADARLRQINVGNFDEAACRPTPVGGLRVHLPGDTRGKFVPLEGTGCAGKTPEPQLVVDPFQLR